MANPKENLKFARDLISKQGGVLAPLPLTEEELNPGLQDDLSVSVNPLENTDTTYEVPFDPQYDSALSDFQFFEDGKQRTVHIGYIPVSIGQHNALVPIHFFCVASVILMRKDSSMQVWSKPKIRTGILVEKSLLPDQQQLLELQNRGFEVVDTEAQGADYYNLRRRALQKAKDLRLQAEDDLISDWGDSGESKGAFLVVDGTLMNLRNKHNINRCVGVSKSFESRYFDISSHNRILEMKQFHRSWAFRFHSEIDPNDDPRLGGRDRISWYLRLRSLANKEPEFGLVRVEISTHYGDKIAEFVPRFSRSILAERLPADYPAARWDNHLYPIASCESYLSSVMPSIKTISASMGA